MDKNARWWEYGYRADILLSAGPSIMGAYTLVQTALLDAPPARVWVPLSLLGLALLVYGGVALKALAARWRRKATAVDPILEWQREARRWEFEFLKSELPPIVHPILDEVTRLVSMPLTRFSHEMLPAMVPEMDRLRLLHLLESHQLIAIENALIIPTGKGKEFVEWRGPYNYAGEIANRRAKLRTLVEVLDLEERSATQPVLSTPHSQTPTAT